MRAQFRILGIGTILAITGITLTIAGLIILPLAENSLAKVESEIQVTQGESETHEYNVPDVCDYCGEAWRHEDEDPRGYVSAYKAWVHESCYEDHHGM